MSLSKETIEEIERFAKEQANKHLSDAELSYFERLSKKSDDTKNKIMNKISKFKVTSDDVKEASDDLSLYMEDYMNDLMAQGHSEKEAFEMAKETLKTEERSSLNEDIHDKYREYYANMDLEKQEAIGLYYGGFFLLGGAVGAIAGSILGTIGVFNGNFWITFGVSTGIGLIVGIGLGLIKNASIMRRK